MDGQQAVKPDWVRCGLARPTALRNRARLVYAGLALVVRLAGRVYERAATLAVLLFFGSSSGPPQLFYLIETKSGIAVAGWTVDTPPPLDQCPGAPVCC